MMRQTCLLFAGLLLVLPRCYPQKTAPTAALPPGRTLTDQQWREDLAVMQAGMQRTHKNLFHTVSPQALQEAFEQLSSDLPGLNDDQVIVRMMQIGAMVRDGHSGVDVTFRSGLTHVPLWIARYDEGIFIRSIAADHRDAVGARVLRIGGIPWQDALGRIDTIVDCDPGNDGQRMSWQPSLFLSDPLVLHGLSLSESALNVTYTLEKDGRTFDLTLAPSVNGSDMLNLPGPAGWVDAQKNPGAQPFDHPWTQPVALAYVPQDKAIYLQFNAVAPPTDESMEDFAARFTRFAESHNADRLVVDVRHNSGGDNTLLRPLLVSLVRSEFNHRGGIFVLIGPWTFSAAQNFVNRLESYADAIFVGEPTSNNVNFFGDPASTDLPNSHLDVEMAHLWWQDKDPRDKRTGTFPEIAISQGSFADYVSGKDAALDFALHAPIPIRFEDLMETASAKGKTEALSQYKTYADEPVHRYENTLEKRLNTLGYELMETKQNQRALVLFQVNAEAHPDSANAFDSLGDGYEAVHDNVEAVRAYERSIELEPANEHAKGEIKRLKNPLK